MKFSEFRILLNRIGWIYIGLCLIGYGGVCTVSSLQQGLDEGWLLAGIGLFVVLTGMVLIRNVYKQWRQVKQETTSKDEM